MKLVISPQARREMQAAARWYDEQDDLGNDFLVEVDTTLERIRRLPTATALWRAGRPYRKGSVHRFPYTVFFVVKGDVIRVLAVAHAKRRPGYWLGRARA